MKTTKWMLSGVMVMLVALFFVTVDAGRSTWLSGAAVVMVPIAAILFIIGLVTKN